jgi:hypothetical protein
MQTLPVDPPADLFRVTRIDLDRMAHRFEQTGLSCTLTELGRYVVAERLQDGYQEGCSIPVAASPGERVRIWDPRSVWQAGDVVITAGLALRDGLQVSRPVIGEVIRILGNSATLRVDGSGTPCIYGLMASDRHDATLDRWRSATEDAVAALRDRSDEESRIDHLLWARGERIWGELLDALREDARFIALRGQWFLRSLAVIPSRQELEVLARVLLRSSEGPWSPTDLAPWHSGCGASSLFGLDLAMHAHPDLFTNIDPGAGPRWILAGPPPGPYTARQAAYDPESYQLLCEPGDLLPEEVVHRLWALDLLDVIV